MSELHSPQAERSIVGTLLAQPKCVGEVVTELMAEHFDSPAPRALYDAISVAYYAGTPVEPVAIAGPLAQPLSAMWACTESEAVERVVKLADSHSLNASPVREYGALIRRYAERRDLGKLAHSILAEVEKDEMDPGAIAGMISQRSLAIASNTIVVSEIENFGMSGRHFLRTLDFEREATKLGIDLGVQTGINAIDQFTRGIRPGRLFIMAGEPGVGKSSVAWKAGLNFAIRQAAKPPAQRMATLILSMEMGEYDSSTRFAQTLAEVDGEHIQDATLSAAEVAKIVTTWGQQKDIPLYLNYAPNLRCSQMLAIIAEGIRKYNVGFVIIDHFRTFDLDKRLSNTVDEDEEKARFLKEQIARTMNVAVLCLAHTRKPDAQRQAGRPYMADLRGSGQIAAHADVVSFIYRPIMYADQRKADDEEIHETDAEIIYRKNRQGALGVGKFYFDPATMSIH